MSEQSGSRSRDTQHTIVARSYPEMNVAGFTYDDVEIAFATQVRALLRPDMKVLDFGAGRGEWFEDDTSGFRRELQLLKGKCAEVVGCDVDPAVHENRAVDRTVAFDPNAPLPFAPDEFDLIVSRYVFEHIENPAATAKGLLRITKPGGWICALTPNKWGYPAIGARLISNKHHAAVIREAQPGGRAARDVFPTRYRLNTLGDLRRHFGKAADVFVQRVSGPPSYYFGSRLAFGLFSAVHKLQPRSLSTALMIFIRKRP